jgi:hypothetical protein
MWRLAGKHVTPDMGVLPGIIHYLDIHSGSLQLIASIVLVLVTTVYTILTRSMAKAATAALRPYVYLDLAFQGQGAMAIVVNNSGTRVASNVQVKLVQSNNEELANLVRELPLATGIGHLSPGNPRKYRVIINSAKLLPQDAPAATLDFEVTYHDGARSISDKQTFDLGGYRSALVFDRNELSDVVAQLREIASKMPRQSLSLDFGVRKSCPYCSTLIAQSARKCPSCHEWLSKPFSKRLPKIVSAQIRRGRKRVPEDRPKGE